MEAAWSFKYLVSYHGVTIQKTTTQIFIAVKTTNLGCSHVCINGTGVGICSANADRPALICLHDCNRPHVREYLLLCSLDLTRPSSIRKPWCHRDTRLFGRQYRQQSWHEHFYNYPCQITRLLLTHRFTQLEMRDKCSNCSSLWTRQRQTYSYLYLSTKLWKRIWGMDV